MAITLKPSQVDSAVRHMLTIPDHRPVFLWGPPGIGKSEILRGIVDSFGDWGFVDLRGPTMDPVDVRGLPYNVSDPEGNILTQWARPSFLKMEGKGVILCDELNSAPQSVQVAFYQLCLDFKVGDHELGKGWRIIAAGNRLTDGGAAIKMPSPLANRFVHIEMEVDLDDWCNWALTHDVKPEVIAFLRFRPALLHEHKGTERAFPTPRSWSFVSNLIQGAPKGCEHALIAGAVGEGAATECVAFLDLFRKLPNMDALLMSPDKAPLSNDPATRYAIAYALAHRATPTNFSQVVRYLDRMPEEYAVLAMKAATQRDNKLAATTTFTQWAVKHAHILS